MYSGKKTFKSRDGKNARSERTTGKFRREDKEQSEKPFKSIERPVGRFQKDDKDQTGKPKRVIKIKGIESTFSDKRSSTYSNKKDFSKPFLSRFKKSDSPQKSDDGRIRLNRVIANSGICSRREADDLIAAGLVSVNGNIVTEMGTKVFLSDDIRYNGERLKQERLVYILLNKPKDYVTTMKDPNAKRTVLELIAGACKERVVPVGRLDRNTTGVLLFTNDGELTKKITHPSFNRKKIYHVHLDKNIRPADMDAIAQGIELEDGFVKADEISFVDPVDKKQVGVEIHSGKNRVVRRMFEHLEYKVVKLDRVYFAGLTKKGLQRGEWRFLTSQEISMLKSGSYK